MLYQAEASGRDGCITVKGEVDLESQRRAVQRAVRNLTGVRGVTNLITVRPRATRSPEELKARTERALARNIRTEAEQISVEVEGDRVVLTGTLPSWTARHGAERIALSAPGCPSWRTS